MRTLLASLLLVLALPAAARALGPGDVDTSFGTGGSVFTRLGPLVEPGESVGGARDVAAIPGGGLVVAGSGPDSEGDRALAVARYTSSGRPERSFSGDGRVLDQLGLGPETSSAAAAVLALPGGAAIVAGNATSAEGRTVLAVARYSASGQRTWAWRPVLGEGSDAAALELALDSTGRVLVVGRVGHTPLLARLDAVTGTPDSAFGGGTGIVADPLDPEPEDSTCTKSDGQATAVLEAADGSVIVGGSFMRTCAGDPQPVALLRRYDAAGVRDASFATGDLGIDRVTALAAAPFNTGVVAAGTVEEDGATVPAIARITAGALDTDFPGPTGFGPLPDFAERPGSATAITATGAAGNLIVGVDVDDPERADQIVRTDAGGQRDRTFDAGGLADAELRSPRALSLQGDGKIVVIGDHPPASAREAQGFALVRLFGGDQVSNVSLRSSAPMRKGALRLRLTCSAGPGCAGVIRGAQVGGTAYAVDGGGTTKVDVPVLVNRRNAGGFLVKVTNPPAKPRRLSISVSR